MDLLKAIEDDLKSAYQPLHVGLFVEKMTSAGLRSVLFHSDREPQYTSEQFRRFWDEHNIVRSFSAPG